MERRTKAAWTRWSLTTLVIATAFLAAPREAFGQG